MGRHCLPPTNCYVHSLDQCSGAIPLATILLTPSARPYPCRSTGRPPSTVAHPFTYRNGLSPFLFFVPYATCLFAYFLHLCFALAPPNRSINSLLVVTIVPNSMARADLSPSPLRSHGQFIIAERPQLSGSNGSNCPNNDTFDSIHTCFSVKHNPNHDRTTTTTFCPSWCTLLLLLATTNPREVAGEPAKTTSYLMRLG
ncbi:hypothetical protein CRG98_030205 [Punica granatum]|uniref:Uncharacterized protein n=1 Tax=Punica granatum TaxID=22663 RepID=A0A2I0IZG2_PUNGR|nr:hypothetical protein CRG98_030205 [Punica granatum]